MGRRRFHAAFLLYKTLGYPELGYYLNSPITDGVTFQVGMSMDIDKLL